MNTNTNNNNINTYRKEINKIDEKILNYLAKRKKVVAKIGKWKKEKDLPILDKKRWQKVIEKRLKLAQKLGLKTSFVEKIYNLIHKYSLELEK